MLHYTFSRFVGTKLQQFFDICKSFCKKKQNIFNFQLKLDFFVLPKLSTIICNCLLENKPKSVVSH